MTLVLLLERPSGTEAAPLGGGLDTEGATFLRSLRDGLSALANPALPRTARVVLAEYQSGSPDSSAPAGELGFSTIGVPHQDPPPALGAGSDPENLGGDGSTPRFDSYYGASGDTKSPSAFASAAAAFVALADWLLRDAEGGSSLFAIHATYGGGSGSAAIERAAGLLKTALDFRGAPGWLGNLWLTQSSRFSFPNEDAMAADARPLVKSLFRMSSPLGETGRRALGVTAADPSARCLEAGPALAGSVLARSALAYLASVPAQDSAEGVEVRTFLLPKEGEELEECQDVLSVHANGRRVVISDGAGTASYSAEWARALCRRAVLDPPPAGVRCEPATVQAGPGEGPKDSVTSPGDTLAGTSSMALQATALRDWLDAAVKDWSPEVPWERLLRPAMHNKAKAGSGATLAGVEFVDGAESGGIRFRAWALGDSCVIHLRAGALLSSRPIARAAEFGYDPKLLMTRPGFEEKYVQAWQSWEASLEPGDWLMLATDALCEYVLRECETGVTAGLLGLFGGLLSQPGPQAWRRFEEFVRAARFGAGLRNDDVALALLRMRK